MYAWYAVIHAQSCACMCMIRWTWGRSRKQSRETHYTTKDSEYEGMDGVCKYIHIMHSYTLKPRALMHMYTYIHTYIYAYDVRPYWSGSTTRLPSGNSARVCICICVSLCMRIWVYMYTPPLCACQTEWKTRSSRKLYTHVYAYLRVHATCMHANGYYICMLENSHSHAYMTPYVHKQGGICMRMLECVRHTCVYTCGIHEPPYTNVYMSRPHSHSSAVHTYIVVCIYAYHIYIIKCLLHVWQGSFLGQMLAQARANIYAYAWTSLPLMIISLTQKLKISSAFIRAYSHWMPAVLPSC